MKTADIVSMVLWGSLALATSHSIAWSRGYWSGVDWHGRVWGPVMRRLHRINFGTDKGCVRMRGDDGPSLDEGVQ